MKLPLGSDTWFIESHGHISRGAEKANSTMCLKENWKYLVKTLMTTLAVIGFLNIEVQLWGDESDSLVLIP